MTVDLVRSGRRAPGLPSVDHPSTWPGSGVHAVLPVVVPVVAIGLAIRLLLVAPSNTIEAAFVLAIPCLLVRLRRAEY